MVLLNRHVHVHLTQMRHRLGQILHATMTRTNMKTTTKAKKSKTMPRSTMTRTDLKMMTAPSAHHMMIIMTINNLPK
jgi:hypothetical protein